MKRFLLILGITLILLLAGEFIAHLILKWDYNELSFHAGVFTTIIIYVFLEIIYKVKDRSKDGIAKASFVITVKDANDEDEIADTFSMGVRLFNAFRRLGKHAIDEALAEEATEEAVEEQQQESQ